MGSSLFTNDWLEQIVSRFVLENPLNRLNDFGGLPIFQKPIIGVADGKGPLFEEFLTAVSPRHLMPRDLLKKNSRGGVDPAYLSVVSYALPFTEEIRCSNRGGIWPSRPYSLARNNGGTLIHELNLHLRGILKEYGKVGISPSLTEEYDAFRSPEFTFASSWSERHVAYAAGLGRFGLNGALITPLGANVRFGSIITDIPLKPTSREKNDYRAECLANRGKKCSQCMERCPVNAISLNGLDKEKCYERKKSIEGRFMDEYPNTMKMFAHPIVKSSKRKMGYSLGCALCQVGVPCEDDYPEFFMNYPATSGGVSK